MDHQKGAPPAPNDTRVEFDSGRAEVKLEVDPALEKEDVQRHGDVDPGPSARDPLEDFLHRHYANYRRHVGLVHSKVNETLKTHGRSIKVAALVLALIGYFIYFGFAIWYSLPGALVLIIVTSLVACFVLYRVISSKFGDVIDAKLWVPLAGVFKSRQCRYFRWALYIAIAIGVILFVALDIARDTQRLTSFFGMIILILLCYVTSRTPHKVRWRPVVWGLVLQFVLGLSILRWEMGFIFFRFLGHQVEIFLNYADEGSKFVFGDPEYLMHKMAFKVFPAVIYFSAVISIFYYWGLMQFLVCKIAWLMQVTMGTTAIESLNAATNIFIGMAESVVMLRPFVPKLTKSELHAVMTGGFATVSGSYMALLVEVGATPEHLLSAAIMSAPAALALAKLNFPETEVSHTRTPDDVYMDKTPARNVVEAASNGAVAAIKVIASVAANLIAILGLVTFLNATLSYLGSRVGYPELSFQLICSYLFWPLAAIMGVEIQDAQKVASLLGTKVFVDEFISFRDLGELVKAGEIAERSAVIATYACCGFGSIAAMGIYIGALSSIAPEKRGDISEVAIRAVINGNAAGFLTACIAGILYTGQSLFVNLPRGPDNITADVTTALMMASQDGATGFL